MLTDDTLRAIERLFIDSGSAQGIILQGDDVLLDFNSATAPLDVFAVQKAVLALLIGIAEEKYLIETLDHINHLIEPEWTQLSPWDEAKLSVETLLSMTTGMADDLTLSGEINQTWRYNNVAYNYLKLALTEQSGMSLQTLSNEWLFAPLGMSQTSWVDRDQQLPNGEPITALFSTAKDLAQLGKLILAKGQFEGRQLVPDHYFEKLLDAAPEENPAWCWGLWRNDADFYLKPMAETKGPVTGSIVPNAPSDLLAARGAYGNYLHVAPKKDLVIVRTHEATKGESGFEQALWSLLAA